MSEPIRLLLDVEMPGMDGLAVVRQLRRVANGLKIVDPALAAESLASGTSPLTNRDTEVLRVVQRGGRHPGIPNRTMWVIFQGCSLAAAKLTARPLLLPFQPRF